MLGNAGASCGLFGIGGTAREYHINQPTVILGFVGAILGPSWGHLGAILESSWDLLELFWGHLGVPCGHLGEDMSLLRL